MLRGKSRRKEDRGSGAIPTVPQHCRKITSEGENWWIAPLSKGEYFSGIFPHAAPHPDCLIRTKKRSSKVPLFAHFGNCLKGSKRGVLPPGLQRPSCKIQSDQFMRYCERLTVRNHPFPEASSPSKESPIGNMPSFLVTFQIIPLKGMHTTAMRARGGDKRSALFMREPFSL